MADIRTSFGATAPVLAVLNGIPTTTSTYVAEYFGKQHAHVLRDIRNLIALDADQLSNFGEVTRQVHRDDGSTVEYPEFRITEEGFMLLAMGFTGKKALGYKLAFVAEFKRLRAELVRKAFPTLDPASPDTRLALTGAALLGAEVQAEALAQLAREESLDGGRWMLSFVRDEYCPDKLRPHVKRLEPGTYVTTLSRLADNMSDPASMHQSEDLAHLARACLAKLERRAAYASQLEIVARQAKTQR